MSAAAQVTLLSLQPVFMRPSGSVVGTDIALAAITSAREGAATRRLRQVSFLEGNPAEMAFEGVFDFVVGRCVLHHQIDPSRMLRGLARHVRPGGVILF